MALIEVFIFTAFISYLFYKWATAKYGTFKQRGVAHDAPWPLIGNLSLNGLLGKTSFFADSIQQYRKFKDSKLYGVYNAREPMFFVRDLKLIKRIGIKDFDAFPNQRSFISDGSESLLSRSLIALKGREWKDMRNILTPAFTGSKMRLMYELVNECCMEGIKYVKVELQASGKREIELEMKDYFTRFTNDVIASAAFGIKLNSYVQKDNEFFRIGKSVTQFSGKEIFKALLFACIPKIMKALGISIFDKAKQNYFGSLVLDAMKYREKHNIIRPDMIQLLLEAKRKSKENNVNLKDEDLLAQCMLFFFGGFETVSTCLCFTSYELLMNAEVQQQLYEEIVAKDRELNGEPISYDALNSLKYLDMVISESLRKWPPVFLADRECTADIKMHDENGEFLAEFKKGDEVFIPISALHYDPEYFSDPETFDPLRFSDERKQDIKQFTYLPFGLGPRSCIANRMALMEVKSLIYYLVLNFQIYRTERTVKDMLNDLTGFNLVPKHAFWTKFVLRDSE